MAASAVPRRLRGPRRGWRSPRRIASRRASSTSTIGSGARADAGRTLLLPAALDPELADVLGYGRREAEFAPILAAVNADLAGAVLLRLCREPGAAAGAPQVYVGSAIGEFAPPEAGQQVFPHDEFPPMVLHLRRPSASRGSRR